MRSFTTVAFRATKNRRYAHHSLQDAQAAFLFFDLGADVAYTQLYPALRVLFPDIAVPLLLKREICGSHRGWAVTTDFRIPPPVPGAQEGEIVRALTGLHTPRPTTTYVDTRLAYRDCNEISHITGDCPCEYSDVAYSNRSASLCTQRNIFPLFPIPVEDLLTRRSGDFPSRIPKRAADFTYVPNKLLTDESFQAKYGNINDYVFSGTHIESRKGDLSEASTLAAKTRAFKTTECKRCVFKCATHAVSSCEGHKTNDDVAYTNDLHPDDDILALPGFTVEQRNMLLALSGRGGIDGWASEISSRRTKLALGFFCGHGRFRVFADCGDHTRSMDFASWTELCRAMPVLSDWYPTWSHHAISDATLRVVRIVTRKRFATTTGRFSNATHELGAVIVTYGGSVDVHFRRRHGETLRHTFDCENGEADIYTHLHGEGSGYHVFKRPEQTHTGAD